MAKEKLSKKERKEIIHCDQLSFAASEAYKLLRTNLQFSFPNDEKQCHIIGVTSSMRGEGKSTTAVNLAYTLAQSGKRVLLIDADMRLPTIHTKLNLRQEPGLSNLLAGMVQSRETLIISDYFSRDNWYILPAGAIPPNPSELLGSSRMKALLESYSQAFNYIILDLPPVNIVTDALAIAPWVDGLVLAVRQNHTTRSSLDACMYQVEKIGPKFLGFIMTDADMSKTGYGRRYGRYGSRYGYGSGYGYGYGYGSSRADGGKGDAFAKATDERPGGSSGNQE